VGVQVYHDRSDFTPPRRVEIWQDKAECLDEDPNKFFSDDPRDIRDAKELCGWCEVKQTCLIKAMKREKDGRRHGVFGGLTAGERDKLGIQLKKLKEKEKEQ
jgi:hypothetical protein